MSFRKDNDVQNLLNSLGLSTANGGLTTPLGNDSGETGVIGGVINAQPVLAGVGNGADTTMDVLKSRALQPNLLANAGDEIVLRAHGVFGATANNKRVQAKFGATIVADSGVVTDNAKAWSLEVRVVRASAGHQIANGKVWHDGTLVQTSSLPTEDETGAIPIETLGGSTTTGAANDVVQYAFKVSVEPAA